MTVIHNKHVETVLISAVVETESESTTKKVPQSTPLAASELTAEKPIYHNGQLKANVTWTLSDGQLQILYFLPGHHVALS